MINKSKKRVIKKLKEVLKDLSKLEKEHEKLTGSKVIIFQKKEVNEKDE